MLKRRIRRSLVNLKLIDNFTHRLGKRLASRISRTRAILCQDSRPNLNTESRLLCCFFWDAKTSIYAFVSSLNLRTTFTTDKGMVTLKYNARVQWSLQKWVEIVHRLQLILTAHLILSLNEVADLAI